MAVHALGAAAVFDASSMEASQELRSSAPSVRMRRESMVSQRLARGGLETTHADSPQLPSSGESNDELGRLLQEVEHRAWVGAKRGGGGIRERLTRVPITDEIVLSVRNIEDQDAHLVEKLARLLRRIGRLD